MTNQSDVEAKALIRFAESIGKPIQCLRWPSHAGRETKFHLEWRRLAELVFRMGLYIDSGLELPPGMYELYSKMLSKERDAHEKMRTQQRKAQIGYDSGTRKTPPSIN